MENPSKMDDLGVPPFRETSIYLYHSGGNKPTNITWGVRHPVGIYPQQTWLENQSSVVVYAAENTNIVDFPPNHVSVTGG